MPSDASTAASIQAVWRGIQVAAYALLVEAQIDTMTKAEQRLRDIADFELGKAGFLFDRYTQKIVPCEDKMISLSCDAAPYMAKYDSVINRIQASVRSAHSEVRQELKDCASIWCYGATVANDRKMAIAEAAALADAENVAIRIEDAKEEVDKEKLWARMATMVNLGRGFSADASASARTAMSAYGKIAGDASAALSGNLQGLGDAASRLFDPYSIQKNGQGISGGSSLYQQEVSRQTNQENFRKSEMTGDYYSSGSINTPQQDIRSQDKKSYDLTGFENEGTPADLNYSNSNN